MQSKTLPISPPLIDTDLAAFISTTPKRKQSASRHNKLTAFEPEIRELHKQGFSAFRIQEFIELKGLKVSKAVVSKFLLSLRNP